MRHFQSFSLLMVALLCCGPAMAEDASAPHAAELAVLKHYVGEWNVNYETEKAAFSSGKQQAQWTLDGQFLRQTAELDARFTSPPVLKVTKLVTYDGKGQRYRSWMFVSNGRTSEATGKWDAETSTMTWTSLADDGTTHIRTEKFGKDGVQRWTVQSMDAQKAVVGRAAGTSTRLDD